MSVIIVKKELRSSKTVVGVAVAAAEAVMAHNFIVALLKG
jgi:hypothetical protein